MQDAEIVLEDAWRNQHIAEQIRDGRAREDDWICDAEGSIALREHRVAVHSFHDVDDVVQADINMLDIHWRLAIDGYCVVIGDVRLDVRTYSP